MQWLQLNWFWVLIGIAFIGMHMFGHGGHGGHGKHVKHDRPGGQEGLDRVAAEPLRDTPARAAKRPPEHDHGG